MGKKKITSESGTKQAGIAVRL